MRNILCILLLALAAKLSAQSPPQVTACEGEVATVGALTFSYTLGEAIATEAVPAGSLSVSAGFQQPWLLTDADSVWPGDANYDLVANNYDVLALGMAYGASGPARPGANLSWSPQASPEWLSFLPGGANYKHSDTNGDGVINANDTLAITLNYNQTHNRPAQTDATGTALYTNFTAPSANNGDTAELEILLGTALQPASSCYGVAFTLSLDTALYDQSSLSIDYEGWLGDPGVNLLTFSYMREGGTLLDVAMVRTDQQNQQGFGAIARVSLVIMVEDLSGKQTLLQMDTLPALLAGSRLISSGGQELDVAATGDSLLILSTTAIESDPFSEGNIHVLPNPASDYLQVGGRLPHAVGLRIFDSAGREVWAQENVSLPADLPLTALAEGVYQVQLLSQGKQTSVRFVIER